MNPKLLLAIAALTIAPLAAAQAPLKIGFMAELSGPQGALGSAIARVKGNLADKKSFMAALKLADFKSLRAEFKFNTNGYPNQDLHVLEVFKDDNGCNTLKSVATPLKADKDAYFDKRPLK